MLELLLVSICLSSANNDACKHSWDGYSKSYTDTHPELGDQMRIDQNILIKNTPKEAMMLGTAVYYIQRKEFKIDLSPSIYVSVKDEGQAYVGYHFSF